MPSTNAMIEETTAAKSPIPMLVDKPASVRANMSRPKLSVPNGCSKLGASRAMERSLVVARGVTTMPNTATATRIAAETIQTTLVRFRLFTFFA